MSPLALLSKLNDCGIRLSRDGEDLVVDAPDGALTPELVSEIRDAKEHLLQHLIQAGELKVIESGHQITRATDRSRLPLSFAQQRLWYLDQLEPGQSTYNLPFAYDICGNLDPKALEISLNIIVKRHEVLRTSFPSQNGIPFQSIDEDFSLEIERLPSISLSSEEVEIDDSLIAFAMRPFDLKNGPLFRAALLGIDSNNWVLILVAHHAVFDGASIQIFEKELAATYAAIVSDIEVQLEELPLQFGDFAKWQSDWLDEQTIEKYLDYWIPKLGTDYIPTELPADFPRPSEQSYNGSRVMNTFGSDELSKLKRLAIQQRTTAFVVLMAAFLITLHILSRRNDVTVGFPIVARSSSETDNLIGYFVNTVPLRTRVNADAAFVDLIKIIRDTVVESLNWSELPFEKLVGELNPPRDMSRSPIFQIFFSYLETGNPNFSIEEVCFHRRSIALPVARADASLFVTESDEEMKLVFEYNTDLMEQKTAQRVLDLLCAVIGQVVEDPNVSPCALKIIPEQDERLLTTGWNATDQEVPVVSRVDELITHHVSDPDRPAVEFEGIETSYGLLQQQANQLSNFLRSTGVKPGDLVGIHMERSSDMLVAILGVMKAGCAYLPLDPGFPAPRLAYMLTDSGTRVLITQESLIEALPDFTGQTIAIDRNAEAIGACPTSALEFESDPQALAYVLYTSGSTGRPKGVMVPHSCVVNFLSSMAREPGLSSDDTLVAVTTTSFDISVLELFLPLTVGAKVVIASSENAADGDGLKSLLESSNATVMQATPASWRILLDAGWKGAQNFKVLCGGEPLPQDLARELIPMCGELWNLYGPTETTIWSSCAKITDADAPITIGRPIANTQIYVLDDNQQLQPIGVPGELCIAGAGVSLGYMNQAALTSDVFIANPFSDDPEARLYRSGDLVRWRNDGTLQHLGRIDDQVKIRGFRIELGEIESVLAEHASAKAVACNVWPAAADDHRLVAYIVPADKESLVPAELRNHLRGKVPDYMVPQHFEQIESIPLTANGKIDRKSLARLGVGHQPSTSEYVEPVTDTERTIARIWSDSLQIEKVSTNECFFDIGGHSLLAISVIHKIDKEFGVRISPREMMLNTLQEIAESLPANSKSVLAVDSIPRRPADMIDIPLSSGQNRLWYMAQIEPDSPVNNIVGAFRLTGQLDVEGLESALNQVVQRHEVLRTELRVVDEGPSQQIQPEWQLQLEVKDFTGKSEDELRQEINSDVLRPFELTALPLFRWSLYRLSKAEHVLFLVAHHCVIDGISISELLYEAGEFYRSFIEGTEFRLEPVKLQYADYAIWQRDWLETDEAQRQLEFWVDLHRGEDTPLDLPLDHPRPHDQSYRGDVVHGKLDRGVLDDFESVLKHEKSTVFMGLLSVLSILLQKYSRQESVNVGVPVAGRGHSDIEDSIGFFVNTLVYHLAVDPEDTFAYHLGKIREACFDSFRHQDIPFDQVVRAINPPRDISRTPLYQVFFGYHDQRGRDFDFGKVRVEPYETDICIARTDLSLWVVLDDDGLSLTLEYCIDLFERSTAIRILEHFENLIRLSAELPQSPIWQLNPLSESDQALQLGSNQNIKAFPFSDALSLIVDAARQYPDATALIFEDEQVSYTQLMQNAVAIARLLEREGLQPESIVGIYMDRSPQMVASILGIWMAGCAYLPLDPEFPESRLQYMADKSQAVAILTCGETNRDAIEGVQFIEVDVNPNGDEHWEVPSTPQSVKPESLGYTIFTSGSTGQPKGVLVSHRAIANLLQSMSIRPGFSSSNRLLAVTTLSFDISVLELLLPLSVGGSLVIASNEAILDAVEFIKLLTEHEVDTLQATPAAWKMLLSEHWQPNIKGFRALCGGEAMPENIASGLLDAGCELWNMYGPTETTIWSTCSHITDSSSAITLGEPIHNTECFVVDAHRQLCPLGVPGELLIAGDGLTDGYIGDADQTDERFVDLDIPGTNGIRKAYRTGDIVLRNAGGELLYKGRDDDQIKIRGYRIEIGDIESSLLAIDGILEAAVIVKVFGASDSRLLAFLRFAKGFQVPTTELRRRLGELLPAYMIPQQFIQVQGLPLTTNGKVDRKALTRLGADQSSKPEYVEPVTDTERTIARIWSELLQVEKIGIDQNFFDIGGHSLLSISAIQKISKEFGVRISPRDMMLNTLQQIAKSLPDQLESRAETDSTKASRDSALTRLRDRLISGLGK